MRLFPSAVLVVLVVSLFACRKPPAEPRLPEESGAVIRALAAKMDTYRLTDAEKASARAYAPDVKAMMDYILHKPRRRYTCVDEKERSSHWMEYGARVEGTRLIGTMTMEFAGRRNAEGPWTFRFEVDQPQDRLLGYFVRGRQIYRLENGKGQVRDCRGLMCSAWKEIPAVSLGVEHFNSCDLALAQGKLRLGDVCRHRYFLWSTQKVQTGYMKILEVKGEGALRSYLVYSIADYKNAMEVLTRYDARGWEQWMAEKLGREGKLTVCTNRRGAL